MNETIKELEERVERLNSEFMRVRTELTEAQDALSAAKIAAAGVTVGQVVKNARGKEFRVSRISAPYESIHVTGSERKKNGDWGIRTRHLGILGHSVFLIEQAEAAKA